MRGCSVGIGDCTVSAMGMRAIETRLKEIGDEAAKRLSDGDLSGARAELQRALTGCGSLVVSDATQATNMFAKLVRSGSKGSVVNLAQVVACVGQQSNTGIAGADTRTSYHTRDRARLSGFCQSSFYKGLNPIEFFNHTVSGREGLIDTAVKTSSTGYVQRRIIKSMEPISVAYDLTVRRGGTRVLQPRLGGNGLSCERMKPVRPWELLAPSSKVLEAHGETDGTRILTLRSVVAFNHKVFGRGGDALLCPFDANALLAESRGPHGSGSYRAKLKQTVLAIRGLLGVPGRPRWSSSACCVRSASAVPRSSASDRLCSTVCSKASAPASWTRAKASARSPRSASASPSRR